MLYDVIFKSGFVGLLIWLLLFATSTAAAALAIRCAWILRQKRFGATAFREQLLHCLNNGKWDDAQELCRTAPSVIADIATSVLATAYKTHEKERQELATGVLEKASRAVLRLINSLTLCSNIAPMIGLLGTVTGMVDSFLGLGTAVGPEKASILAISISHALYTTAAGLLIAIPSIVCAVVFRNLLEVRVEYVIASGEKILAAIPEPDSPAKTVGGTQTQRMDKI